MFHKRQKKVFPPGTFIATPARVTAILHLCFAFTLFLWIASQPFMGDLFAVKSKMLLYESVLDKPELMKGLPFTQQLDIKSEYETLKKKLQLSFPEKFKTMLVLLLVHTPALELAWLFFSLVIPIMLLMRIEGAAVACWLLPVITLAYSIDNYMYAESPRSHLDKELFPSEEYIVHQYLDDSLSNAIFEQQVELTKGWHLYLIENWARERPADDSIAFMRQVTKGEFAFNLAHLQLHSDKPILAIETKPQKQSIGILALYLAWNCFFAFMAFWWVSKVKETSPFPPL